MSRIASQVWLDTDFGQYYLTKKQKLAADARADIVRVNEHVFYYYSPGNIYINNNNNGHLTQYNGQALCCRHLSYEWLFRHNRRLAGSYHDAYSSDFALDDYDAIELRNNDYDEDDVETRAQSYTLANYKKNGLGKSLYHDCHDMGVRQKRYFNYMSDNHVMALVVDYKMDGWVVVKFYDPNKTEVHYRCVLNDMQYIQMIELGWFVSAERLQDYFPEYTQGALARYESNRELRRVDEDAAWCVLQDDHSNPYDQLYYSAELKHKPSIETAIKQLFQGKELEQVRKISEDIASYTHDDVRLVEKLASYNESDHLFHYLRTLHHLLNAKLTVDELAGVLNPEIRSGHRFLNALISRNDEKAFVAWLGFVLQEKCIDRELRVYLLKSEDRHNGNVLATMIRKQDAYCLEMYLSKILMVDGDFLDEAVKYDLVTDAYTNSASQDALEKIIISGNIALMHIYVSNFVHCRIGEEHMQRIRRRISLQTDAGDDRAYVMLKSGQFPVKDYVDCVMQLDDCPLRRRDQCNLIFGNQRLLQLLQHGTDHSIRTQIEIMCQHGQRLVGEVELINRIIQSSQDSQSLFESCMYSRNFHLLNGLLRAIIDVPVEVMSKEMKRRTLLQLFSSDMASFAQLSMTAADYSRMNVCAALIARIPATLMGHAQRYELLFGGYDMECCLYMAYGTSIRRLKSLVNVIKAQDLSFARYVCNQLAVKYPELVPAYLMPVPSHLFTLRSLPKKHAHLACFSLLNPTSLRSRA